MSVTVDIHCHFIPPDLPDFTKETGDPRWPRLHFDDEDPAIARIFRGPELFRVVRAPCWRLDARLAEMKETGVDVDVMSPIPVSLTYWSDPKLALQFSRHINDWLSETVQQSSGQVKGLGTVPLQDTSAAVEEMMRAMELGLSGIEIGTVVGSHELDSPVLRPFFAAAAREGIPLFVHPIDGDCATRATNGRDRFAIGMHTDSALAGSALVFGGVLEDCPGLRVCLSHGGGALPWTYPRLRQPAVRANPGGAYDELLAQLWVDGLVFDPLHLGVLKARFGSEHILYGTDYPFLPRDSPPAHIFDDAVALGLCSQMEADEMRGANALGFLAAAS